MATIRQNMLLLTGPDGLNRTHHTFSHCTDCLPFRLPFQGILHVFPSSEEKTFLYRAGVNLNIFM